MVLGLVADVAGAFLLLEAADAVLQIRRARSAHGRARFSSRRYGQKPSPALGFVAKKLGSTDGRPETSGNRHGSEEFARKVSETGSPASGT